MKTPLEAFQDAFAAAIYGHTPPAMRSVTAQAAFEVYRNTVLKGSVDALCANFPTVERLVGTDWLRAAAVIYARETPPDDPRLIFYGEGFADFLERFEPARELPYLGPVARLDRMWIEAFTALVQPQLDPGSLGGVSVAKLATCQLQPRTSVRWCWFSELPIFSIWRYNREALPVPQALPWQGEGALVVGQTEGVIWYELGTGGCAFLDACAAGCDLDRASTVALAVQPDLDFHVLLGQLLGAGVFRPVSLT